MKTKTGNIFFGRLYDPLDDKLLILRKAKLVIHGEQEVWDTLGKIVSQEVSPNTQENYLSIPWDEIEALQIVEKGLYRVGPKKTKSVKLKCELKREGKIIECEILEQE